LKDALKESSLGPRVIRRLQTAPKTPSVVSQKYAHSPVYSRKPARSRYSLGEISPRLYRDLLRFFDYAGDGS
jgi:hypothetical protein